MKMENAFIQTEQFLEDSRFEKDYTNYYQRLTVFGIVLVIIDIDSDNS